MIAKCLHRITKLRCEHCFWKIKLLKCSKTLVLFCVDVKITMTWRVVKHLRCRVWKGPLYEFPFFACSWREIFQYMGIFDEFKWWLIIPLKRFCVVDIFDKQNILIYHTQMHKNCKAQKSWCKISKKILFCWLDVENQRVPPASKNISLKILSDWTFKVR